MKRALSLFVSLCLLVSLCGTMLVSAEDYVEAVNITGITVPAAGQTATVDGIVCDIPDVTMEATWMYYDYASDSMVYPADTLTFAERSIYRLEVWLTSEEPVFSYQTEYFFNGQASQEISYYGETRIMVTMDYITEGGTILDTLNITGIGNTDVGSVMTTANLQAEGAEIYSATWSFDGEYQEGVSVFEDDMNYLLDVYARPAEGYIFAPDMTITFEGMPCDILWQQSGINMNAGYQVRHADEELSDIGITALPEEIAAGAVPALDVSVQDGYASVKDVYWTAADQETKVTAFEEGKAYYLAVELEADQGYVFGEYTSVYSGWWDTYAASLVSDGAACTAYFYYSLLPDAQTVDITITGAEVGKKGTDVKITVSGVEAELDYIDIYDTTEYETLEDGVFEEGKGYIIDFKLTSDSHEFNYNTDVTVNGEDFEGYGCNGGRLYVDYYVSFLKKIDTVALTVTEPTVGAKPGEVKVPEGANYTVEYSWRDMADWNTLDGEDVFQDGIRYELTVSVYPNEGYDFAKDAAVTLNGATPDNYYMDSYRLSWLDLSEEWTFADPIDKIELPQMPESIQVGGTPAQIESVETDKYTIQPMWMNADTGDLVTTFEDGNIYMLLYAVAAKDGYEITEDTQVLMGGEKYTGVWYDDYTGAHAMKCYVLGIEIVDRVDITVTEPALGEEPSKITVADNDKYEISWPEWLENETGDIFDDTDDISKFTTGKYFFAAVSLEAKDGYAFDETTKFYVNGVEVEPYVFWALGRQAAVALRYEPLTENTANDDTGSNSNTGDQFPMAAVIVLMVLAALGVAVVIVGKRKFVK